MSKEGPEVQQTSLMEFMNKATDKLHETNVKSISSQEQGGTLNRFFSNNPASTNNYMPKTIDETALGPNAKKFYTEFEEISKEVIDAITKGTPVQATTVEKMVGLMAGLDQDLKGDPGWNTYWDKVKDKEGLKDDPEALERCKKEMLGAYRMRVMSSSQLKLDMTVSQTINALNKELLDKKNPVKQERAEEIRKELEPLNKKYAMLKVFTDMNLKINTAYRDKTGDEKVYDKIQKHYQDKFVGQVASKFGNLLNGILDKAVAMKRQGKSESEIKDFIKAENNKVKDQILKATGTNADNYPQIFGVKAGEAEYNRVYSDDKIYAKALQVIEHSNTIKVSMGVSLESLTHDIDGLMGRSGVVASIGNESDQFILKREFEDVRDDLKMLYQFTSLSQTDTGIKAGEDRLKNITEKTVEFNNKLKQLYLDSLTSEANKIIDANKNDSVETRVALQVARATRDALNDMKIGDKPYIDFKVDAYKAIDDKLKVELKDMMVAAVKANDPGQLTKCLDAFKTPIDLRDIKTQDYNRKPGTWFRDVWQALKSGKPGKIFQKPERSLEDIIKLNGRPELAVLVQGNQEKREILNVQKFLVKALEEHNDINKLVHKEDKTYVEKWLVRLHNEIQNPHSDIDLVGRKALVGAIETLKLCQTVDEHDDPVFKMQALTQIDQIMVEFNEGSKVYDMLRGIGEGQDPTIPTIPTRYVKNQHHVQKEDEKEPNIVPANMSSVYLPSKVNKVDGDGQKDNSVLDNEKPNRPRSNSRT